MLNNEDCWYGCVWFLIEEGRLFKLVGFFLMFLVLVVVS